MGFVKLVEWIVDRCVGIEKTVLLVRHAEALHNASQDCRLRDPELTGKGVKQAQELAKGRLAEGMRAEVLVVSPMRRTLQTAVLGFAEAQLPLVCYAGLQETGEMPCDTGSDKA